jgi:hypothetical protein
MSYSPCYHEFLLVIINKKTADALNEDIETSDKDAFQLQLFASYSAKEHKRTHYCGRAVNEEALRRD